MQIENKDAKILFFIFIFGFVFPPLWLSGLFYRKRGERDVSAMVQLNLTAFAVFILMVFVAMVIAFVVGMTLTFPKNLDDVSDSELLFGEYFAILFGVSYVLVCGWDIISRMEFVNTIRSKLK
eukprot:gb/GECH01003067.1/.p1 GENE.gb/GECH01003067.1/~~gb/GECH01003067.1/.p1  ORF type:complete len:123 (+),score=19.57 gb/GECH01003067.1/:1-369(+)